MLSERRRIKLAKSRDRRPTHTRIGVLEHSELLVNAAEHRHLRLHLLLVLGLIVLVSFEWLLLRGILVVRFVEQRLDAHQQVLDGERGLPTLR